MNVKQARAILAKMPDDAPLVVAGYYGEIDQKLDEFQLRELAVNAQGTRRKKQCCVLVGLAPSYPEPD